MRTIQTVVGAIAVAALGMWLFGGYDAAGIGATLTSWVELGIRLLLTAAMMMFFLNGMWLAHDSFRDGKPKEAAVLVFLSIVIMFLMPTAARMGTINAAKELNRTLVESEPYIDTAAQNVVRIVRRNEGALVNLSTPTPVPTAMVPIISDLVDPLPTVETVVFPTLTPLPTGTRAVTEVPFDISQWNPATPPPTPVVGE